MNDTSLLQIALLYMLARLYMNISQVYMPFYLTMTQNMEKVSIQKFLFKNFSQIFPHIINEKERKTISIFQRKKWTQKEEKKFFKRLLSAKKIPLQGYECPSIVTPLPKLINFVNRGIHRQITLAESRGKTRENASKLNSDILFAFFDAFSTETPMQTIFGTLECLFTSQWKSCFIVNSLAE